MHRMTLVAVKDFTFKGRGYVTGDRLELPVGDAYKVLSRRQAKRSTGPLTASESLPITPLVEVVLQPVTETFLPADDVVPDVEEAEEPVAAADEPDAAIEVPRRRRRRKSADDDAPVSIDSVEPTWNSES